MDALCRLAIDSESMMSDERLSTARVSGFLSNNGKNWLSSRLGSCWEAAIIFSGALTDTVAGASLAKTLPRCPLCLSIESNVLEPALLAALIAAHKTCRKYASLQTASRAVNHLQLNATPLCLLPFLLDPTCPKTAAVFFLDHQSRSAS